MPSDKTMVTDPSEVSFGVVLVNYNGWDDTIECLESLFACSKPSRIVVVDNASLTDRSKEIIERFPGIHWINSQENTGWSGGNNLGIRFFINSENPPDAILLLNNDTVVATDIFDVLSEGIRQGYDVLGPVINEYSDRQVIQTQGTAFNRITSPEEFFDIIPTPPVLDRVVVSQVDIVNGCAVAITKKVFEKIGMIDDRFFLICEESDFCLRALERGFRCGVVHRTLVWHKHSVTFKRAGKPIQRYYGIRNLWLLLKLHPNGVGRKKAYASRKLHLRRAYHIYCHEREMGNKPGAHAVCDGLADAYWGRFGKWTERTTIASKLIRLLFHASWTIRRKR